MFKLAILVLAISAVFATDYTIYGTSGTAPYTTMSTSAAATSTNAYKLTFLHKTAAAISNTQGTITVCCTTAVSDSSKSALKDKCFVFQSACNTATCDTTATSILSLGSGTVSGTTVTITSVGAGTVTYAATGSYTGVWEVTAAQTALMGLPDSMSPSYKVDVTCNSEVKSSGQSAAVATVTKPTGNAKTFSFGSGAMETVLSVGAVSVVSAFYALF